jgi:two-component system, NarL family, sensor histidine kinase UhpB
MDPNHDQRKGSAAPPRRLACANLAGVALAALGGGAGALVIPAAPAAWDLPLLLAVVVTAAAGGHLLFRRTVAPHVHALTAIRRTLQAVERGDWKARAAARDSGDAEVIATAAMLNRLLDGAAADRLRLRDVAARAFRAQEAERWRIARELQEEIAQVLATVLFRLRAARQMPEGEDREGALDAARAELTLATEQLRRYARTLNPPALRELGLVPALEGYARALSGSTGLLIRIVADDLRGVLPAEAELALYRIVQEALGNAARHAGASTVLVRIRREGGHVRTFVEDDGRGFDVEETESRLPCLGLFGMRERALSVSGTVEIDAQPGNGTRLRIQLPTTSTPVPWPVILGRADAVPAPRETAVPPDA